MTYYRTIFYPNLTKKKAKKTLSSKFARFRKEEKEEEKERGESVSEPWTRVQAFTIALTAGDIVY